MTANKVKAEGPGLCSAVEIGKPTYFTVNATAANRSKLAVHFTGPGKGEVVRDSEIIHHHDNTYTVKFTPVQQGITKVNVTYGGDQIPRSPFIVVVAPTLELGKIKVSRFDNEAEVGREQEFTVISTGAGGQGKVAARITGPPSKPVPCRVEPGLISDCSVVKFTLPEEGFYKVDVTYDGVPVSGSPFAVEARPPTSPSKVNAYGAGLKGGVAGCLASFTVDAKGAGSGGLHLCVEGPGAAKYECWYKRDGTCSVSYLPMRPGDYIISILFSDAHVPGSPFKAQVVHGFESQK